MDRIDILFLVILIVAAIIFALLLSVLGKVMVAVFTARFRKRLEARAAEMTQVAADLGLEYQGEVPAPMLDRLKGFSVFSDGIFRFTHNLLLGRAANIEMAVFDHSYRTSGGQQSSRVKETVVCFFPKGLTFPQFRLAPEQFYHRIGGAFGMRDFNWASHPLFSRAYRLTGDDEKAVRAVFTPEVLDFFESRPGFTVETDGEILVVYRHRDQPKASEVPALIDSAKQIFTLLAPHAQAASKINSHLRSGWTPR